MLYQLANGKTIKLTEDQFLKMTDQDLKDLEGSVYGYVVNDPFLDSALMTDPIDDILDEIEDTRPEIDEDFLDQE